MAISHFSTVVEMRQNIDQYLLRFANKKGEPKVDMPKLDGGRCVVDTNVVRFTLCDKEVDGKMQEEIVVIEDLSTALKKELLGPQEFEKADTKEKKRRSILCCFYSD